MPSVPNELTKLVAALRQSQLLEPDQLRELVETLQQRFPDADALGKELVRRGWLTRFQIAEALSGRAADLVRGPYVLLDVLGRGGMGQVFKARHRLMNRLVALKVIRPDLLAKGDSVPRFRREIQAAAQLMHPNIVIAYHAEQVGDAHLLAMEYCDGLDLGRLVSQRGPLEVGQACECIRQAALGLQHACERGLVHRDIKPSNLLLTGNTVKILDFGLALLRDLNEPEDPENGLTHAGAVMGTPDFLAPEQALDAHSVDIRADLYSLGCTFYYLLAGHAPFVGGKAMKKVLRHQLEAPPPLEHQRDDVPAPVLAVVNRLLAKDPADRFQTPDEVAKALQPWARREDWLTAPDPSVRTGPISSATVAWQLPQDAVGRAERPTTGRAERRQPPGDAATTGTMETPQALPSSKSRAAAHGRKPWLLVTGVAALLLLIVTVASYFLFVAGTHSDDGPAHAPDGGDQKKRPTVASPRQWQPNSDLAASTNDALCLTFSPTATLLAVGTHEDKNEHAKVVVWDLVERDEVGLLPVKGSIRAVAFSPDGGTVASGMGDWSEPRDGMVFLWDVGSRKTRHQFHAHDGGVYSVAFHPDGKILASSGKEKTIKLWDATHPPIDGVIGPARSLGTLDGHSDAVNCVTFSRNGKWLASASADKTVILWDMESRKQVQAFTAPAWVFCVAFSPDDKVLAATTGVPAGASAEIRLWDVESRQPLHPPIAHGGHHVYSLAFAPDGATFVTGCQDGYARVWDLATGKQLDVLPHGNPVWAVAYSPDGQTLATGGGWETPVKLWKGK